MRALWRNRAEVQAISMEIANAIDDIVSAINVPPFQTSSILFPTTQVPSKNAYTFDDYRELAWTPIDASGAGLVLTIVQAGRVVKVGQQVIASALVTYPATANVSAAAIGGLPNLCGATAGAAIIAFQDKNLVMTMQVQAATSNVRFLTPTGGTITNAQLTGGTVSFTAIYLAAV